MYSKKLRSISFSLLAFAVLWLFIPATRADVLSPGGSGSPDNFTSLSGVTLLASTSITDSGPNGFSFTFNEAVYSSASGTLDFLYQVDNTSSAFTATVNPATTCLSSGCGAYYLTQESNENFAGFTTDVGYITNGSTLPGSIFSDGTGAPDTVDRSADGTTVDFNFGISGSNIAPGVTTDVLVIATNATNWDNNGDLGLTFADVSLDPSGVYEPINSPEPSSLLLLSSGLVGLGFMKRKVFQS
jgi:hypothetical protein